MTAEETTGSAQSLTPSETREVVSIDIILAYDIPFPTLFSTVLGYPLKLSSVA